MSQIDDLRTLVDAIKQGRDSYYDVLFGIMGAIDTIKRLARMCKEAEYSWCHPVHGQGKACSWCGRWIGRGHASNCEFLARVVPLLEEESE